MNTLPSNFENILQPLVTPAKFYDRKFRTALLAVCHERSWSDDDRRAAIRLIIAYLLADFEEDVKQTLKIRGGR